ncbi:hypothetical protein ACJDT4_12400 [Clostridium neuense]|uniref:Uncharacterized protein n=1 Tax=Clostridium neuense TaxID=1728934 RepID=A0ABW8TID5_9CLOT
MAIKYKYLAVIIGLLILTILLITVACLKAAGRADDWRDTAEKRVGSKKHKQ